MISLHYLIALLTAISLAWMGAANAADPDAGKSLYSACIACHGANAEGNAAVNGPSLGGQAEEYLSRQLKNFKSGVRGSDKRDKLGAQMAVIAATLTDETAIANIAAYIASLPPSVLHTKTESLTKVQGDLRNGNNIYQGNCGACHGHKAQGNPLLNSPRLVGLDERYMIRQFQNFSQGIRGAHPEDKYGKQMKFMTNSLTSDKALQDVVAYIQSLTAK